MSCNRTPSVKEARHISSSITIFFSKGGMNWSQKKPIELEAPNREKIELHPFLIFLAFASLFLASGFKCLRLFVPPNCLQYKSAFPFL